MRAGLSHLGEPAWPVNLSDSMPTPASVQSVRGLIPFKYSDLDAVNEAFERWRAKGDRQALAHIDLWTYCYVHQYFASRRWAGRTDADHDRAVAEALARAYRKRLSLRQPTRYAQWLAVLCRNAFVDAVRLRRPMTSLDYAPTLVAETTTGYNVRDRELIVRLVEESLAEQPAFLQAPARLRLLDGLSYTQIAEAIGKPQPTIRAYVSRVVSRLRKDPRLRAVWAELRGT